MTLQYEISNDDWNAYLQFCRRRIADGVGNRLKRLLAMLAVGALLGVIVSIAKIAIDPISIFLGCFGSLVWLIVLTRLQSRTYKPSPDGVFLGSHTITIADDGIKTASPNIEALYQWKVVRESIVTDKHVFILVDAIAAITVPRRSFKSAEAQEQFIAEINKHRVS